MSIRIGEGYDSHQLVIGRPLILGGVSIPFERGLKGHSDADVLYHAVIDALLGALSLGDIGQNFPDHDEQYRGANSRELLRRTKRLVDNSGYRILNLDSTVIAEAPKLFPYVVSIRENLAADLDTSFTTVSVKAKTNEKMGWLGRGEGIAARCVVLLQRI